MCKQIYSILILLIVLFSIGCNGKGGNVISNIFSSEYVDKEAYKLHVQSAVKDKLDQTDSILNYNKNQDIPTALAWTYQLNDFATIWFNNKGLKPAADSIISFTKALELEGVKLSDALHHQLDAVLQEIANVKEPSVPQVYQWDSTITHYYLTAAQLLQFGKPIKNIDNQWFVPNDSVFTGPQVLATFTSVDSFPSYATFRPSIQEYQLIHTTLQRIFPLSTDPAYKLLKQRASTSMDDSSLIALIQKEIQVEKVTAVDSFQGIAAWIATYQAHNQLKKTGKLDDATLKVLKKDPTEKILALQANLERLRNMPQHLGTEYVWVNIPLMQLQYIKDSSVLFKSNVIVGKPARATPSISAPMTNIVFNPPWGVPPTILKNDVGPGIARSGSGYLARKGLRAYDSRGRDVTASVNAGNYRNYMISQPPGARNALGDVKFNMPNKEAIFIHDTPDRGYFNNANRAISSGCIRTDRPRELAELILNNAEYSKESIASIINTRKTKSQDLDRHIPVYIMYLTVAPNAQGDGLVYLQDIYGRDKKMIAAK